MTQSDSMEQMAAAKAAEMAKPWRRRLALRLRRKGWAHGEHTGTWRHRVVDVLDDRWRWWDWGHRAMVLVGQPFGGSWDEPRPDTWWYRTTSESYPVAGGRSIRWRRHHELVKSWDEMRARTEGLDEDAMHEWQALCADQDGDLRFGRQYWGGEFYGLSRHDVGLLIRWLLAWELKDWFGLRSRLWRAGLTAAVYQRRPFGCNQAPPAGSGGYSHWLCELDRHHAGPHRFRRYTWSDGEGQGVVFDGDRA